VFPGRYGRRNVVNRSSLVCATGVVACGVTLCVGLLVQILDGGRARSFVRLVVLWWVWVTSPRPISTGRLGIAAVHLRPIDPVVCGWPYPIVWVGNLILKCASRLDAFSGYHVRT
jgi:hypothetical protein